MFLIKFSEKIKFWTKKYDIKWYYHLDTNSAFPFITFETISKTGRKAQHITLLKNISEILEMQDLEEYNQEEEKNE